MKRAEDHRRIPELERVLTELNETLVRGGADVRFDPPQLPVVLIVGCARSGSTLFLQWMAASGQLGFPTNLASRFYGSARAAGLVQRALLGLDAKGELFPTSGREVVFSSELGKTFGAAQPHEFWYFWRRFFQFGDLQVLSQSQLDSVDVEGFLGELGGFQQALGLPLVLKAHIVNWHIAWLMRQLPTAIVVHVERDRIDNARSLLRAREAFYGSRESWYSFRPPEYPRLAELDPLAQVLEQVAVTNDAIRDQLAPMDPGRHLHVRYEAFCADPAATWSALQERFQGLGFELGPHARPDASFERARRTDAETEALAVRARELASSST